MIDYSVAWEFFINYVSDIQDPTITSEQFCSTYGGEYLEECITMRDELLARTFEVMLHDLYFNDYDQVWVVVFEYFDGPVMV